MGDPYFPSFVPAPAGNPTAYILDAAGKFEAARLREQERQRTMAALASPRVQQMFSGITGPGNGSPALMPGGTPYQSAMTNTGAEIMAPTLGYRVPVLPSSGVAGLMGPARQGALPPTSGVIGTPDGQFEEIEITVPQGMQAQDSSRVMMVGDGRPGSTAFMENVDVQAPGMMGPRNIFRPTSPVVAPSAPMTPEEFEILKGMSPYYTQMQVVRESAQARRDQTRESGKIKNDRANADRAVKLLELHERSLNRLQSGQLARARLAAKKSGDKNNLIKVLHDSTKEAQSMAVSLQQIIATMDGQGASAAEPGSPLRENYDRARQQLEAAQSLYSANNDLYQQAVGRYVEGGGAQPALPRTPRITPKTIKADSPDTDWENLSDEELRRLAGQ